MDKDKLTKAKYGELQLSIWGACFIAFALGVLLSKYIGAWIFLVMAIGVAMHSIGMYRIHQRNK